MSAKEERKVIFDESLTLWRTGNHVDITIVNHPACDCLEVIVYDSDFEKEAPRMYVSSSKLFPHVDQVEYHRIIDEARNHHHIFMIGSGDKAQEAFEITASKYLTSRVTIYPERNNIDHFEVYLSSQLGDTIDNDYKLDTAIVHGSLPDGHHHLDVVIPQPVDLIPFPILRKHTTQPKEFFQAVRDFHTNTQQAAALNNDALHHLHVVENVVDHLKTLSTADLNYSMPKQRWKRAIRRVLFQLAYGKVMYILKKFGKRHQFLSSCANQQPPHRHGSGVQLQPLAGSQHHMNMIEPLPPKDMRPSSGVGRLNPVIVCHRHNSRSTSPTAAAAAAAHNKSQQDFIGEVHHHHYMLNMLEEHEHKHDVSNQAQQTQVTSSHVSPQHHHGSNSNLLPGWKTATQHDTASQAKESNNNNTSSHNIHLEPIRPSVGSSRPSSAASSRSGSRVPSRSSSPLHHGGSLPQLGALHLSPDSAGGGSFFPAAGAQAKNSPDHHSSNQHQARDRYYERYHPEKLQQSSLQHGGSSHHLQPLPPLTEAVSALTADAKDEDHSRGSSSGGHHHHHQQQHSSLRIFHK